MHVGRLPRGARSGAQDERARDREGHAVVVAVGGHYRSAMVSREDLMLHIVNVRTAPAPLRTCTPC